MAKKNHAQDEQTLETERQKNKDALRDVQDRLDKHLDESLAIDNQLLSKFYLKNPNSLPFVLAIFITELRLLQLRRVMAMS